MSAPLVLMLTSILLAPSTSDHLNSLLRFPEGSSTGNTVTVFPDLSAARSEFSVCTWLRKRLDQSKTGAPWFSYTAPTSRKSLLLTIGGFHVMVASGISYPLKFEAKIMRDEWYHTCFTWKSGTAEYYINGVLVPLTGLHPIGKVTVGGTLVLGQGPGNSEFNISDTFSGDIYQLNVFKRTLTMEDVSEMYYNGRCAELCRALAYQVVLSWADVLEKGELKGEVTKEDSECSVTWGLVGEMTEMLVRNVGKRKEM